MAKTADKGIEYATAITLTGGFGKYQTILLCKMLPISISTAFCTHTIPYIMPAIVCELGVSKYRQGVLLSAVYCGMVIGGFIWGVISDTLGRRRTLLFILSSTTLFEFLSSFSLNYWFLFACKFLTGLMTCGCLTTCYAYASEFIDTINKDTMIIRTGCLVALGFFLQPLLAAAIIPISMNYVVIPDFIIIQSWKIFIICSAIVSLLGLLSTLFLLKESPQFLLEIGQGEKSLEILREIYFVNTGKPPDTFPITKLAALSEEPVEPSTGLQKIPNIVKPITGYPYLLPLLMAYACQGVTMAAFSGVKLYQSILFTLMLGIGQAPGSNITEPLSKTFCFLFEKQQIFQPQVTCEQESIVLDPRIYLASAMIAFYVFISLEMTRHLIAKLNKMLVFVISHLIAASCMIIFPFGSIIYLIILLSIYFICMQNCITISISLVVDRVPHSFRGLSIGLIMVFGRFGVILGAQILPYVSDVSCISSFWCITLLHLSVVPLMIIYSKQPNPFGDRERRLSEEAEALRHLTEPN